MIKNKKINKSVRKILAFILTLFILCSTVPMSVFAADVNLGDVENNTNIPISYDMYYGHELHTTTVNGQTYPLFCIEYGKSSPNSSNLGSQGVPSDAKVLEAARWIFAGYYMEHGNSINWLDMAYCQKKVWSVLGSETSWNFSNDGYNAWINNAQKNMDNLNKRPSFDGTNIGTFLAGTTHTVTDTNGVLKDYPSFTQDSNGIKIVHESNSNLLTITIDKSCTITNFAIPNSRYKKIITGDDRNCLLYNPSSGGTQKLLYSAYYDPIGFSLSGTITPLGNIEITKQDNYGVSVDGAKFGLYTDKSCTNQVATGISSNGVVRFNDLAPSTYYAKEIYAPKGFLLSDTVTTVTVTSNNTSKATVKNAEPAGTINLTKVLDVSKTNGKYGDVNINEAEYSLYAAEDIKSANGTKTFYKKGTLVTTQNVNAEKNMTSAKCTLDKLPLGKYILKESKAPEGTIIDFKEYNITLSYKNQSTSVIENDTTSTNVVKSMKVKLFKAGTNGSAGELAGLEGAEFTFKLYADYENAIKKGYKYEEIWSFKDSTGTWVGLNESGKKVSVDAKRAEEANGIAPTYDVITTDSNGIAVSSYLPYGKYIAKETATPIDYTSGSDFSFSIINDESEVSVENKVKYIAVNNAPVEYPVKIVKKDADSDKIVSLSSATFKIRATENIYDTTTGKLLYSNGDYVKGKIGSATYSEFMTNSEGFVIPSAPTYATTNDDSGTVTTPFKLPAGNYEIVEIKNPDGFIISENTYPFVVTSVYDYDIDADGDAVITVTVKNEQPKGEIVINKSFAQRNNIDKTFIENINYTKIGFRLIATKDIIDKADGSIVYKAGTNIGDYYLDSTGKLTINNLWIGEYTVKEFSTISGAVLDDTEYNIVFTVNDNTTKVYTKTLDITNYTTEVDISKTDITGEKELEGAELTITDADGNVIDSWTSTNNSHKIEGLLVGQTYTMTEEYAPETYVISNEIQFTVENTKDVQTVKMIDKQLEINKVDNDNNPVLGAELTVTSTKTKQIVDKWTTTKDSHFVSGLIEGQSYVVTETLTPEGFVTANPVEFTVTADKNIQYVSVVDKQVTISKTDVTTGDELEGAELTITDADGNVIDSWTSTTTPHIASGLVEGNTYTLTETKAPYGFQVAESIEFTVTADKGTQKVVMSDDYIYSSVRVVKCDITTKQPIISNEFEFSIYSDKECKNLIATSGANKDEGTALFSKLKYGTYYIAETKAPVGYSLSDQVVEIVINDKGVFADGVSLDESNGVYSFEYYDELLPVVETGDNANGVKSLILMGAILVVFVIIFILISKKMKSNKK